MSYLKRWQLLLAVATLLGLLILTIFVPLIGYKGDAMTGELRLPEQTYVSYLAEYQLPTRESAPMAITVDQAGDVWVAATNATTLLRFSPISKRFAEFKIPTKAEVSSIWGMTADKEGRIWFTSADDNSIWRFDTENGSFKSYPIPTPGSFPMRITTDKEGQI